VNDADLARLDPAQQALAMLTGLSFTVELQLALTMSYFTAEQARAMAGVMVAEWRTRATAAQAVAGDGGQVIEAAGFCVERIVANAMSRAENIRTMRAANAAAAAMSSAPTTGTVN